MTAYVVQDIMNFWVFNFNHVFHANTLVGNVILLQIVLLVLIMIWLVEFSLTLTYLKLMSANVKQVLDFFVMYQIVIVAIFVMISVKPV